MQPIFFKKILVLNEVFPCEYRVDLISNILLENASALKSINKEIDKWIFIFSKSYAVSDKWESSTHSDNTVLG